MVIIFLMTDDTHILPDFVLIDLTSVTCHLKPVTSMTISLRSICTQTDESYLLTGHKDESTWTQDADVEQQHTIKGTILDYPHASDPIEMLDNQSEFTEDNIHDLSFYSQAESMDTDITDITDKDAEQNNPCERKFIVFESCLNFLLQICPECGHPVEELTKTVKGSLLIVNRTCTEGHCSLWTSQPLLNGMAAGNLLLSAAILFSGCTYRKISHLASIINLQVMAERTFHSIQRKYLFPVVHRAWSAHQQGIFSRNNNTELVLCGDGRCDSPGYSAKYCTYTMMSEDSGEIVNFKIVQVTETNSSVAMEKEACKRCIDELIAEPLSIKVISTDRHTGINAMCRKDYPHIDHQFDIWHVIKSISKKVTKAGKNKECNDLIPWTKSICNHMWWACQTCEGNAQLLRNGSLFYTTPAIYTAGVVQNSSLNVHTLHCLKSANTRQAGLSPAVLHTML